MVNLSTSKASMVSFASAINKNTRRASEIPVKEVNRNREKGSALVKYFRGKDDQFKLVIKVMAK